MRMNKEKYVVTKQQCQAEIDKRGYVCERCGRKLQPIKTVDNEGNPTYWSGCTHGQGEDGWGHFTAGVLREIYELAKKCALHRIHTLYQPDKTLYDMTEEEFRLWVMEEIGGWSRILQEIEYLKNNEPMYKTIEEFMEDYHIIK